MALNIKFSLFREKENGRTAELQNCSIVQSTLFRGKKKIMFFLVISIAFILAGKGEREGGPSHSLALVIIPFY